MVEPLLEHLQELSILILHHHVPESLTELSVLVDLFLFVPNVFGIPPLEI